MTTTASLVRRLNSVVKAANKTKYYGAADPPIPTDIPSLESFQAIQPTPILEYRTLRLGDTTTNPDAIKWVVGPYLGQSPHNVAYAEDSNAAEVRNNLFRHALSQILPQVSVSSAAVIATHQRRYFGAEMASILVRMGIHAHLFVDVEKRRVGPMLQAVGPSMLVALDDVEEAAIPASVEVCVTARQSQRFTQHAQIDLCVVDELGLLGYSTDCRTYNLNHAECHFEQ
ncbi:MAG: hypothetical protein QF898_13720, partial [SAR202 cluster bacterium]|nr:hypothetical protein [SAR202 cluster bacterium]